MTCTEALKKDTEIIEVDSITSLAANLSAIQNQMITQFHKLGVQQTQGQVNVVQKTPSWYDISGNNGHFVDMCGSSPKSINFVGNAQNSNYCNAYNQNWQTQPIYPWGNNQQKQYQQKKHHNT